MLTQSHVVILVRHTYKPHAHASNNVTCKRLVHQGFNMVWRETVMGASGGTILNIGACEETTKERKIYLLHTHKHNHCDSVTFMSW